MHAGPPKRFTTPPHASRSPEVAQLLATFLTGEPVTHGALAVTPLLAPTTRGVAIPVSCLQQGRWATAGRQFRPGDARSSPSSARGRRPG